MTARLDLENANVTSWVSCATAENGRLRLDASAFFPGGGGQPADTGRVRFSNGNEHLHAAMLHVPHESRQ